MINSLKFFGRRNQFSRFQRQTFLTLLALGCSLSTTIRAQTTQPIVAVHDSELTRALESQPASGMTPSGNGTTGFQWWPTDWHYFVMPEAVKEALRADGTAFTTIGDSNITAGLLLPNGLPKYPIVISLASEAIQNSQIAQLTNYVAAGGYLVVGSSAFTRNPDGTSRGDFAFANELGLHLTTPTLANWTSNATLTKISNHRLLSHIPEGQLIWRLPASSEEISWGTSPTYNTPTFVYEGTHDLWRVQASDATVIAQGDASPYITVKKFGKGYFIYIASFQPLIGHGGNAPGMYAYMIFRQAIEWAFESAKLPVAKLSPWPFEYDAAFIVRHDLENFAASIANIEASAQVEASFGAKGDYYFCTGTLREDMSPAYDTNAVVTSMQRAVVLYGATVGPHNGGLRNPGNPVLTEPDYDFWHWGLDEALDVTPPLGYIDGKSYAMASLEKSFQDIESWLPVPMSSTLRPWCAPRFNSTRDDSLDIQAQVGVKITGDRKLTPFPHWTYSTRTPGKRFPLLTQPVSDWFIGGAIAQSLEPWRPPSIHSSATMRAGVDFYYRLGALINFYSHTMATGLGDAGQLMPEYVAYCANTNLYPRMWSANALGVYDWWVQRSTAQINVTHSTNGSQMVTTIGVSGSSSPRTSVEILVPAAGSITPPQILMNGIPAAASSYRINDRLIKLLVGTSVTTVQISYALIPSAVNDYYQTSQGTTLTVAAPGILGNDQSGSAGTSLTAVVATGPTRGTLNLNASGAFTYTPTNGFTGADSFTYRASNGQTNSQIATVNISVTRAGEFFADDFNRVVQPNQITPWIQQSGTWVITNGALIGSSSLNSYGSAYFNDSAWTNYSVQARLQFSSINALGGGLGGRLNPVTGAHYAAWIYPEGSVGGSSVLKLIKFTGWGTWSGVPMQTVSLPGVGTSAHLLAMTFQGDNITVAYDGVPVINMVDTGYESVPPFTGGGISADTYTYDAPHALAVDDVSVTALVQLPLPQNDSYQTTQGTTLSIGAPGVLSNDQNGSSVSLTASLIAGPTRGTLSLSASGAFTYTPTNNYAGSDSFTYQVNSGTTNYGTATASLYVARPGELFFDDFTRATPSGSIAPWTRYAGTWSIADGVLLGTSANDAYGNAYINGSTWSNYTVQARLQFSAENALGAGLGGRLNPTTGSHYSAWVYPEGSAGGSSVLKLIKFTGWANWSGIAMQTVSLPGVGTNWHTLAMTFTNNNIEVSYDGVSVINISDNNYETIAPYGSGGISVDMYTYNGPYTLAVDDVSVTTTVVVTPPVIIDQPVSVTNLVGTTASFSVVASGTTPTFQWKLNGVNIVGATSSTYMIANVQPANAGAYTVMVSNQLGSVTSSNATLSVIIPQVYSWSTPVTITTADNTLNLAGNIVGAAVFGGVNTLVTLSNGTSLLFTADGSVASATGAGGAALPSYGSFFSSSTTGNANFNYVLNQGMYDNGPHAIMLKGLTVGQQYSVQLFALDDRGGIIGARLANYQDPLNAENVSATFAMSNKVYVVATFVATSTNMVIQQNLPISNNGAINAGNINALVVRAIGGTQSPVILTQPASRTNLIGTAASFTVVATGNTLRYQWQFNGASITRATNSTYTISSAQATNAGNYTVVVSNLTTGLISAPATLTMVVAPVITTQPVSRTNLVGTATTFSVVASGTSPAYQWQFNGVNIIGATASSYTLASVQTANAGNYTVVVTNLAGKVTSGIAKLTVTQPVAPRITTQPVAQTVMVGQSATFSVVATGTATLSYQWQLNGVNIAGAIASTYTLVNVQTNQAGNYTVVVTNLAGTVTSAIAKLTVTVPTPPNISTQPVSKTVTAGQSATFSVVATGTAPLAYQWRLNGTNIVGATANTYTVANAQIVQAGSYTVVVSNSSGSVISSAATLSVNYSLMVTATTGGSVTMTPSASTYAPGTAVTLVAKPGLFYRFTGWSGAVTSTATTVTLNMNSNTVVKANFKFFLF